MIFEVCFEVLESTPAHWFKCIYREFRRFSVCNKFLDVLKLVKCNIYFEYKIDFPFHIFKSMASANLKQHLLLDRDNDMDQDWGKYSIQILLWYWRFVNKILLTSQQWHQEEPLGYAVFTLSNTVYLAVMLQNSWHTAEGN